MQALTKLQHAQINLNQKNTPTQRDLTPKIKKSQFDGG
jgi:hypothetical protein